VLISRCAPELSPPEDRIVVAVALWQPSDKGKGLHYLVTSDWREGENIHAEPWSAPASAYPQFAPGTYLALISYGTEHIHTVTAHADSPKSFERVVDTRLFRPVAPTRVTNHLIRDDHPRVHRGLGRRFDENPRADRREDEGLLPYRFGGKTYQLPIRFYYFESEPGSTKGQKANFVAAGHTLVFTSNGQVHHHWGASEFRDATGLMRLGEHVLVVVETDPLPIKLRTDFFTADRSGVRASAEALRLEQDVAGFLRDWDELKKINGELIEQSLRGEDGRETINISRQISRAYALKMRGFGLRANGAGTGGGRGGNGSRKKIDLYPDPTMLEGPEQVLAEQGKTKSIRLVVNATSSFFESGRGELSIACAHPDIGTDEITIGSLRDGRVRVMIAVPEDAKLGEFDLVAGIYDWERASGGLGTSLEWQTRLEIVDEIRPPEPSTNGRRSRTGKEGPQVALFWRNGDEIGLTPASPGKVEPVPASILAKVAEYSELAPLGDKPFLTIYLNNDYSPFKRYLSARQRDLTSSKVPHAKNRYASRSTTASAPADEAPGSIRSEDACAALSAAGGCRAATRRAPTGTAASSSTATASPRQRQPRTPAYSASGKRSSSTSCSTFSRIVSSGPEGSTSSAKNSPALPQAAGTSTNEKSRGGGESWPTSTARSTAKPSDSKSTTILPTRSSNSRSGESLN
jgi:hypothetical protein